MTTSVAGALRAVVVDSGLVSGRVFRDEAPERATFPYVTFHDVSSSRVMSGDGVTIRWLTQVQLSVWQRQRDESVALVSGIRAAVDGASLTADDAKLHRARVVDTQRIVDTSGDVVQHAVTIEVRHDGTTS